MCQDVLHRQRVSSSFLLTIEGKMTFIQFITTFAYATMLATFVSAPLHDVRPIASIIQRRSAPAVVLKNHPSFGNQPIKISPVLSLPQEVTSSKMTMDFERFPVLFNVTVNVASVEFDHLLNMTPHHRRQIIASSPVADTADDGIVLPKKSDLVPTALRSVYNTTTIHSEPHEQDGYALCPVHDVSYVQLLHRDLQFDRSLFISMLLLSFLGSLLEWDNDPAHEEPKVSGKEAFFLLVSPPACDHEELTLSEASFQSPDAARNVHRRTRRSVTWNLDFEVHEIPRLSQQEKMERKHHFYQTVNWSTKNAVSTGELM
jgi:hypothetical protein